MITYGGPELLLLFVIFLVTPVLYRKYLHKLERKERIISISILWLITFLVGYTDVIYISLKARKLCREEAGLHVYKTVKAEGFLGYATDIKYWSIYGFEYVEGLYKGQKTRITFQNGEVIKVAIPEYTSNFEYVTNSKILNDPIVKNIQIIRNRHTYEILGEIVSFKVYPGWIDSWLVGVLGFTWIPPRCDDNYPLERGKTTHYSDDLIKSVIKPKPH